MTAAKLSRQHVDQSVASSRHMSSFADRVRAAANSKDGVIILAEGIDALLTALEPLTKPMMYIPPADSWEAGWAKTHDYTINERRDEAGNFVGFANATKSTYSDDSIARDALITQLEAQIPGLHGEDLMAANAKLALLKDTGSIIEEGTTRGTQAVIIETDDDRAWMELPAPSQRRRDARVIWATGKDIETLLRPEATLSSEEFLDGFERGGPLWLYHYDREAVMQMPLPWRQTLVEDILQDSPATAQEVGRDILKADTETQQHGAAPMTGEDDA